MYHIICARLMSSSGKLQYITQCNDMMTYVTAYGDNDL